MKLTFILSLVFLCANVCEAQLTDSFADSDYTTNPAWTPDNVSNWTIATNQLRSNSASTNSGFYISTPSSKAVNAQWEFFVNLQFNTSSANYVDVYLTSDLADLSNAANKGYFVRIGGTPDEISLYKTSAGTSTILINGTDGITNTSNNTLRIKVIRDAANRWTLERDVSGTGNTYVLEGAVTENTFSASHFFGIKIQQSTSSFFNKHFFDDIYVGEIVIDSEPPVLQTLQVNTSMEIALTFSEKLDILSAQDKTNYAANNNVGSPDKASLQADGKTVLLTFSTAFPNAVTCNLSVSGVKDLVGNLIAPIEKSFLFFISVPAKNKDIIITEFFPDPSPQVGLPDAEFVEIYNRSSTAFDMKDWKLSDGSSTSIFPSKLILPNQYMVIVASSVLTKFSAYSNVLGVSNFPTLNNATDTLTLKSPESVLIDSISYDLSWYRDIDKQEGGWTLELIDPNNPCGEKDNWTASEDKTGGTPGKQNSVYADKPDLTGPHLEKIVVLQPDQLLLTFNEKLERLATSGSFVVTPTAEVATVAFTDRTLTTIQVKFEEPLQTQKLYLLKVDNVRDCNGNFIDAKFNELKFAVPEPADSLDVLVNEILFNPRPNGFDFVEVYNNSPKYINLKNWQLSNIEDGKIKNSKPVSVNDLIIAPQSYLAFTPDLISLKTNYTSTIEQNVAIMTLPSMSDDEGSVSLISDKGKIVDYFQYSDKYHSELIKDPEGVSLERISLTEPTNESQNWKSANSTSGFATPGYLNSNSRPESITAIGKINITPQLFTPNSGNQDFTKINYKFDQSGLIANIKIFDQQGHFIKQLANNESLSYEGFFKWEGDRDDGSRARMGYYLVWFEVFDLSGSVKTFRERVIVAGN